MGFELGCYLKVGVIPGYDGELQVEWLVTDTPEQRY